MRRYSYILLIGLLLFVFRAEGQYMDTVCVGTMGRGYHVFGLPGSTYTWNLGGGGSLAPFTTNDTVFINWGNIPGVYPLSVLETTISGCSGTIMRGNVWVTGNPLVNAGLKASICKGSVITLSGSDSTWCRTIRWTTSGDGTFNNPQTLHPVYTPGPSDRNNGFVVLTLTGNGYGAQCPPATSSVTIRISNMNATIQGTDVTCFGYNDGSALVNMTGAIAPVTYQWNDPAGQTTNPATGLAPGSYSVTVTDSAQCQWSGNIDIFQIHPTLSADLTLLSPQKVCRNDTVKLRVDLTGTPPWNLTYTDGTTTTTINGITSSPYYIIQLAQQSCTYSLVAVSDAYCTGMPSKLSGSAPVTVFDLPSVEFTWQPGSQNFEMKFFIDTVITNMNTVGNMLLWDFGDGTFGYENNPVHLYPADNDFIVTLTINDTNGCYNHVTHTVHVSSAPHAFFSSDAPQCFGKDICFTDLSYATAPPFSYITTWIWNFGDGTPDDTISFPANPNVCHHFSTLNNYPVTLTVIDNFNYYNSFTSDVNMIPNPVAEFVWSGECARQQVQFTDVSSANGGGDLVSWSWDFGDPLSGTDNLSSLQNPMHIFTSGGDFNVRLIINNTNFCSDTIMKTVHMRPSPAVDFSWNMSCLSVPVVFTADTSLTEIDSVATWTWDFGDGTPVSHDPLSVQHTYPLEGQYTVSLTVTDFHGCFNTVTRLITIYPSPVAQFSWNTPLCGSNPVMLTDASHVSSGYISQWHWNFGDGNDTIINFPGSPNISHVFAAGSNNHVVTLTVTTISGCVSQISHLIETYPAPVAGFSWSMISCAGQQLAFLDMTSTPGGAAITSWSWNFGDPGSGTGNTSSLQNPQHVYIQSGTFSVRLITSNVYGCSDTVVQQVIINPAPVVVFTIDTACAGSPNIFHDLTSADIISWMWDFGDGSTSNLQDPVHIFSGPGVYTVTLTVTTAKGCTSSATSHAFVRNLPVAEYTWTSQNCSGAPVSFTDLSHTVGGNQGNIVKWHWDFGDGSPGQTILFPASPDVSYIFPANGSSFTVILTVYTSDSCRNNVSHIINLAPSPQADFSVPSINCDQQQVQFTDHSQGNGSLISGWSWNFDDPLSGAANNANVQNPGHIFTGPGDYDVQLIVVNVNGCRDTVIQLVHVQQKPVVSFTTQSECAGNPVHFSNTSTVSGGGFITQTVWNFGDGGVSNVPNPSHVYVNPGNYLVTLTVTTNNGCTGDTMKVVQIMPQPSAQFLYQASSCLNDTLTFTDSSTPSGSNIISREWNFGDGNSNNSNIASITHVYENPGSYDVTLSIININGCTSFISHNVTVNPIPVAEFTYGTDQCQGAPVHFSAAGAQVISWSWNFGDPASGSANNSGLQYPVHLFSSYGTYTVTLVVSSANGCSSTKVKTIIINQKPVAQFSAEDVCTENPMQFTDNSIPNAGTIVSWQWNFGDPSSGSQNSSNLQNPIHNYSASGSFLVHLTVVNSGSCQHDTSMVVHVQQGPQAMFQYTGSCVGTSSSFTDLSTSPAGQIVSWFWDFGDGIGTSTIQNPDYTYTAAGTYQVKLRVQNANGCYDSVYLPVVSRPAPVASYTYNSFYCPAGKVSFQDVSNGNGSAITERLWIFENGITSNLPDPVHVFPATDSIFPVTLIVTNSNGCRDTILADVYVKKQFSFMMAFDTVCHSHATTFHAINTTPGDSLYFYNWDFGDPASGSSNHSTQRDPVHVFTAASNYVVKLTVTNSNSCTETKYSTVPVYTEPAADFSYVSPDCQTKTLFTDHSSAGQGNIIRWEWLFGDGTDTLITSGSGMVEHSYAHPGYYDVKLIITSNRGCTSEISHLIHRQACLEAAFEEKTTFYCVNTPMVFVDNSTPVDHILHWRWDFGDGTDTTYSAFMPEIPHTYTTPGTYTITLFVNSITENDFFSDSSRRQVNIHWAPDPSFTAPNTCLYNQTRFINLTQLPENEIASCRWNFGDPGSGAANHSSDKDPVHTYAAGGIYPVTLYMKNQFNCADSVTTYIHIKQRPAAAFTADNACSGHLVQFSDHSQSDTIIASWHWNFGVGGTKKDTAWISNPKYRFAKMGDYQVKLVVTDRNGCSDTTVSMVNIKPSPLSAFVVNNDYEGVPGKVQMLNQSENAGSYYWDFGNGNTSFEESPVVSFKEDGNYLITLISGNQYNCFDTVYYEYELLFHGLYVPNAFAPTSQVYSVRQFKPVGMNLVKYKAEVYDVWGHLLWYSTGLDEKGRPAEGWDGRDPDGKLCAQGTYMWRVYGQFSDGREWMGSDIGKGEAATMGTVTLIR